MTATRPPRRRSTSRDAFDSSASDTGEEGRIDVIQGSASTITDMTEAMLLEQVEPEPRSELSSDFAVAANLAGSIVEGEGIFEIRDFTTASSFERIVHKASLAVKRWVAVLGSDVITNGFGCGLTGSSSCSTAPPPRPFEEREPQMLREEFEHMGFVYELVFQLAPPERATGWPSLACSVGHEEKPGLHTFPCRSHRLQRWFGVRHFVSMCVRNQSIDRDSARTILSALGLAIRANALASTGLPPLCYFVLVESAKRHRYIGELIQGGRRTSFSTDQSPENSSLEHLAGLQDFFRRRFAIDPELPGLTLTIGARFIYSVETFRAVPDLCGYSGDRAPPTSLEPTELTDAAGSAIQGKRHEGANDIVTNPMTDPVATLQLHTMWPCFPRGSFVDNEFYSELDPRTAPYWKLRLQRNEDAPLPVTQRLRTLLEFRKEAMTVRSAEHSTQHHAPKSAIAALTFAIQESLESILLPTAGEMAELVDECTRLAISPTGRMTYEELKSLRGAPPCSRLRCLALRSSEMRCFKGCVLLWCQVLSRMRLHWDTLELQPAAAPSPRTQRIASQCTRAEHFDPSLCLVQQKMEMLQRSIEARRSGSDSISSHSYASDCSSPQMKSPPRLLRPALMTDDMMVQFDTASASILDPSERAEMHGREIRSDMSAFKAANIGSDLQDFLRWRSEAEQLRTDPFPQSWLERCWATAKPETVEAQMMLLFQPEREAEMALHYLENIEGTQLLLQLVRVQLQAALEELSDVCIANTNIAATNRDRRNFFCSHLRMLRDRAFSAALTAFGCQGTTASTEDVVRVDDDVAFPEETKLDSAVEAAEALEAASRLTTSLLSKFPGPAGEALLQSLLAEGEADITTNAQRQLAEDLFSEGLSHACRHDRDRPELPGVFESLPLCKEFVLLLRPGFTSSQAQACGVSARLHAEIRNGHVRIAAAHGVQYA